MAALLLELAAADDLVAFRRAVEDDKVSALDASCQWYGPSAASGARLRLEVRTPAMVAALYGSTGVLAYVLSAAPAEAARASPTDGATPLHLAAAGGAAGAVAAAHLLLAAGASADALAFSGLRAGDLLPRARSRQGAGAAGSGARPCAPAERPTARLQLRTCATQNLTNFSDQPRLHME